MGKTSSRYIDATSNIVGSEQKHALIEFIEVKLPNTKFFIPSNKFNLNGCKFFNGNTWDNAIDSALLNLKKGSHIMHYPTIEIIDEHDKKRIDRYYPLIRDELENRVLEATNSKVITYYQLVGAISAANDVASYLLLKDIIRNPVDFAEFAQTHWSIYENGFGTIGQIVQKNDHVKKPIFYAYFSNGNVIDSYSVKN